MYGLSSVFLLLSLKSSLLIRRQACFMMAGCSVVNIVYSALDNDLEVEDSSRIEGLLDENRSLRARILELESLIHDTSNDDRIRNHVTSSTQSRTPLSVSEDIHEIFERLHLDVVAGDSSKDSSELDLAIRPHVWQILPTRPESEKIVRFSLSMLGWVHCALDVPSFEIEHAKFWSFLLPFENADLFNDHAWMAIYFSVIAVRQPSRNKTAGS